MKKKKSWSKSTLIFLLGKIYIETKLIFILIQSVQLIKSRNKQYLTNFAFRDNFIHFSVTSGQVFISTSSKKRAKI